MFDPASGFVRVIEGLDPRESEAALTKTTVNSFGSTDLHDRLQGAGCVAS